jgi:hypothetical protein
VLVVVPERNAAPAMTPANRAIANNIAVRSSELQRMVVISVQSKR